jgi:hypothetical protein
MNYYTMVENWITGRPQYKIVYQESIGGFNTAEGDTKNNVRIDD